MNPLQLMEMHRSDFTPNDLVIYQAILENPDQVVYKTTSRLAEDCGVSQPALSRFVKTLGYNRYQDFRADVSTGLLCRPSRQRKALTTLATFIGYISFCKTLKSF